MISLRNLYLSDKMNNKTQTNNKISIYQTYHSI